MVIDVASLRAEFYLNRQTQQFVSSFIVPVIAAGGYCLLRHLGLQDLVGQLAWPHRSYEFPSHILPLGRGPCRGAPHHLMKMSSRNLCRAGELPRHSMDISTQDIWTLFMCHGPMPGVNSGFKFVHTFNRPRSDSTSLGLDAGPQFMVL